MSELVRVTVEPDGTERGYDAEDNEYWIARNEIAMWWGRVADGPPLSFSDHLHQSDWVDDWNEE